MERAAVREDRRSMAEARTTMDSSSRVEAMVAEARMNMVVNVVMNTTDGRNSKVDMVVVRIIMAVDSKVATAEAKMTMVVNDVKNITDTKNSKVDMVGDRIVMAADSKVVMAEDSKTTALKVDAQEEETFLRAETTVEVEDTVVEMTMILVALLITLSNTQAILVTLECSPPH